MRAEPNWRWRTGYGRLPGDASRIWRFGARLFFLLAAGALLTLPARSQTWSRTFGGSFLDKAKAVAATSDGGVVFTGALAPTISSRDLFVAKLDADGQSVWLRTFDLTLGIDEGDAIEALPGANYAVTGWGGTMLLDATGAILWKSAYSDPYFSASVQGLAVRGTAGGGLVVGGVLPSTPSWAQVYGLDAAGQVTFLTTIDHQSHFAGLSQFVNAVRIALDGGILVAGTSTTHSFSGTDAWVVKLDAAGQEIWQRGLDDATADGASDLVETADGGVLAVGVREVAPGDADLWVLRLDATGGEVWQQTYGGPGAEAAYAVQPTPSGTFVIAGMTTSAGAGSADAWLLEIDDAGNTLGQRTFGGPQWDVVNSICRTADGGFVLAGETYSFGQGSADAWVLKVDSSGHTSAGCPASTETTVAGVACAASLGNPLAIFTVASAPTFTPAFSPAASAWTDSTQCFDPRPQVTPVGGQVGGPLAFQHEFPCCPGLWGVTFLGASGASLALGLPGQVKVFLVPDVLTTTMLSLSAFSVTTLDAQGLGTTTAFVLPNNPALQGLPLWVAAGAFDPSTARFPAATQTTGFALQ